MPRPAAGRVSPANVRVVMTLRVHGELVEVRRFRLCRRHDAPASPLSQASAGVSGSRSSAACISCSENSGSSSEPAR